MPTESPDNQSELRERAELFIATHQQKYSDAIDSARAASATTKTPAWQENYKTQSNLHREIVQSACKAIRAGVESVKAFDSTEDDEKAIRDGVKRLADERIRHSAWRARTVEPYSSRVDECRNLLTRMTAAAREAESTQPLIHRGLAVMVDEIAQSWPRATWDEETGCVYIADDASSAQSEAA